MTHSMTPQDFITKWGPGGPAFELNERQGAQPHFMDLCQLLGGADLVCYWFDKAKVAIESNRLEAAGLVATQSLRAGSNHAVLVAICKATSIYEA